MDTAAKAADMFHSIVEVVDVPKKVAAVQDVQVAFFEVHDMSRHVQTCSKIAGKKGSKKA